ncbi:MAG TPA: rod shape-determining protein [Candidatus Paceibacterota bacterium]
MRKHLEKIRRFVSNDIGIDLGTANTLVYVRDKGIIINEPSVVAVNQKTGQVVAVGTQAKNMLGRTPLHIQAVRPLVGGVISDFEVTEEMIAHLIRRAEEGNRKILGPRVLVGIPCGITNVEARAVRDATKNNGAREVLIIEQPMAAAIGIRMPVGEPVGNMIIDIGGGTTDIAVISLGGIVKSKTLKVAGDRLNEDIISYIRNEFKILIGEKTAENIKIAIGSITPEKAPLETSIRGRDLITGLPREVVVTDSDIREAIAQSIAVIIDNTLEVIETTPPEIVSDIMHRGIYLTGGGALLRGLPEILSEQLKTPVFVSEDPLTAVARGTGVVLENLENYKDILIEHDNALPPTN